MGIQPSEADRLTMWDYGAIMHGWKVAHETEDPPPKPPSIEEYRAMEAMLAGSEYTSARH